jgi:hypothetical protein
VTSTGFRIYGATYMDYKAQAIGLLTQTGLSIPLRDQPLLFLRELWAPLPDKGVLGVSILYANRKAQEGVYTLWFFANERGGIDLTEAYEANNDPHNIEHGAGGIYAGLSSRVDRVALSGYLRGTNKELIAVSAIACDIDCAEMGIDLETAYRAIMDLPLAPSVVTFTGGGLQALWLLSEPYYLTDQTAIDLYKQHSLSFIRSIIGLCDTSINEAARMLRVPGFINRRKTRNGATAQLIYWAPENRYTWAKICEHAPYTQPPPREPIPDLAFDTPGVYAVGNDFITYLVHKHAPEHGTGHLLMGVLARQAARAGMPEELFVERARPTLISWYADDPNDPGPYREFDQFVQWAYTNIGKGYPAGTWLIKLTDTGFTRFVDPVAESKLREKTVDADSAPPLPESLPLAELREDHDQWVSAYLNTRRKGVASLALDRTSPGVGKSRTALFKAIEHAKQVRANRGPGDAVKGQVLFATQYRLDWNTGREWLKSQGVTDEDLSLFGFLIARDDNPESPGYCAHLQKANAFGEKHYNIVQTVCGVCTVREDCSTKWYLSQFKRLESADILVVRHAHPQMESLKAGRKIHIYDENPTQVVSEAIKVSADELKLSALRASVENQIDDEIRLIDRFLAGVRAAVSLNTPVKGGFQKPENVKLGGHWLIDNVVKVIGHAAIVEALALPLESIASMTKIDGRDLSNIPPNYLGDLIGLFRYEYERYYLKGADRWNSRLVPVGNKLFIFPMKAFSSTRDTYVIVLDGTGLPDLYPVAFTDNQGRPRELVQYTTQITPSKRTHVAQYLGTENTKGVMLSNHDELAKQRVAVNTITSITGDYQFKNYTFQDTVKLADAIRPSNPALANLFLITHDLIIRHKGSLLIVTYKRLIGDKDDDSSALYRKWLLTSGIIAESNIQNFFGVRGSNQWKDTAAVLVVGTPRMQEMDLLIQAQVWNWQDDTPISTERELTPVPYYYYEGKPKQYNLKGYKDPRVQAIYLHHMQSELRQVIDRIRANTVDDDRSIYIATALPCTHAVHEFRHYDSAHVRLYAYDLLDQCRLNWMIKSEVIAEIAEKSGCSRNTASNVLRDELHTGYCHLTGKLWWDTLEQAFGPNNSTLFGPKGTTAPWHLYADQKATYEYLCAYPEDNGLKNKDLADRMQERDPKNRKWNEQLVGNGHKDYKDGTRYPIL